MLRFILRIYCFLFVFLSGLNLKANVPLDAQHNIIQKHPTVQDPDFCVGDRFIISVQAEGFDVSYQWFKNGLEITGAQSSTFIIQQIEATDVGTYYVVVMDIGETEISNPISINVRQLPEIEILNTVNGEILSDDINDIHLEATHTGSSFMWLRDDDFITIEDPEALSTTASIKWNGVVSVTFRSIDGPCLRDEEVYIRTNDPLGLDQTISLNNPGAFNLEGLGSFHDFHLSVFDLNGLELLNESITRGEQLGLSSVGKGVYVYRLSYDSGSKIISGKLHVIE